MKQKLIFECYFNDFAMLPKNTILTFKLDRHSYEVDIRLLLVGKNEKNCMEAILYCERCRKAYLGRREKNFHMK